VQNDLSTDAGKTVNPFDHPFILGYPLVRLKKQAVRFISKPYCGGQKNGIPPMPEIKHNGVLF
jgi:hypothetical protein